MVRVVQGMVGAAVAVLLMTGCGPVAVEPRAPDATADDPGWRDPRCPELGDDDQFAGFWSLPLESDGYHSFGASSVWNMQGSALIQAGALVCEWSADDAASSALVIALGDGAEGFRRSEASFADPVSGYQAVDRWDGAFATCRTDGTPRCHWNVLAGTTWLSVLLTDVPSDDLAATDLATTSSADLVSSFVDRLVVTELTTATAEPDSWSCASTLAPDAVADVFEVEVSRLGGSSGAPLEYALGRSTPDFGQTMWAFAQEILGYRECHLTLDGNQAAAIVSAPGGAWALEDASLSPEELDEVGNLGRGLDRCETEGDYTLCTVAVTRGEDLVVVQVPASSTADLARSQAVAIAALIVS
jgi:hypothetical protein